MNRMRRRLMVRFLAGARNDREGRWGAMESLLARCANLSKDEVQRARASQRPSPRRLHSFAAARRHEEIRGPGV
jgi:hypothetical protein